MIAARHALALLLALAAASAFPSCAYDSGVGARFDLSPLRLGGTGFYSVHDFDNSQTRNYTYNFNVCQNLQTPAPCVASLPPGSSSAPAFQIASDGSRCFRLGGDAAQTRFELLGAACA